MNKPSKIACDALIWHIYEDGLKVMDFEPKFRNLDSNQLSITLNNNKNKLSIFSTNIQSINAKIDKLRIFMERLHKTNFAFSTLCVQESWLFEGDDISQILIMIAFYRVNHVVLNKH